MEMTFKGHSRSSVMSSFVRSHGLSIKDRKRRQHLFSDSIEVIGNGTIQYAINHFLLMVCSNHVLRYSMLNNGVRLKSGLRVTQPVNICTTSVSLKSTDPEISFCWWQYGRLFIRFYTASQEKAIQGKVVHSQSCDTIWYDTQVFNMLSNNWRIASLVCHTGSETERNNGKKINKQISVISPKNSISPWKAVQG